MIADVTKSDGAQRAVDSVMCTFGRIDVLGGHASLMQHVLLAGVAAHALGGRTAKGWWEALETDLIKIEVLNRQEEAKEELTVSKN